MVPKLAVVGHPNKGKSSIVSALVEDDSLLVGPLSGMTRHAASYDFRRQGRLMFSLVDTPGFQRPRRVLSWLRQSEVNAAQRPQRIAEFVQQSAHKTQFPDEVELLTPIVAGAAILYVVDISLPYSAEYETEMEILAWTGRPRLALMNPISGNQHQADWQAALGQYFQHCQLFNPMTASLAQRLQLFGTFALLQSAWQPVLSQLQQGLQQGFEQRAQQTGQLLADYWCQQMGFQLAIDKDADTSALLAQFHQQLEQHEQQLFTALKACWHFPGLHSPAPSPFELEQSSLMQQSHWGWWGLSTTELCSLTALSGLALGTMMGAAAGGISAPAGGVLGSVIGAASGWFAMRAVPGDGGLSFLGSRLKLGPVRHPNFPLVVMARALTMAQALIARSHAAREPLQLTDIQARNWSLAEQRTLSSWAQSVQQAKKLSSVQSELLDWIERALQPVVRQARGD